MKKLTAILFIIISIAFACTKETVSPPPPAIDNIIHTNLNPSLEVCPMDSMVYRIPCSSAVPFPINASAKVDLDLNNDGVSDFKIEYRNWYDWVSNSSPCVNYHTSLYIYSYSPNGGIITDINNSNGVLPLKDDEIIGPNDNFVAGTAIYISSAPYNYYSDFGSQGFIGVKLSDGSVGWIEINHSRNQYTCKVLGFAVNTTIGNSIKAGQTN